ncbi:MAG: hypothetical protein H0W50_04570 [Parachlamydiaceae bacterium]|nr:hypothetical protein [Parachlamydiaceae bacterium]
MISIVKTDLDTIEIKYSRKIKMILKGNDDFYEDDDDFFILYTPIGNVTYNKKFEFMDK